MTTEPMFLMNGESWPGVEIACSMLSQGASAMDAAEEAIRQVESNPAVITAGFGGRPNMLGQVELDAALMNGDNLLYGAVGAVKRCEHPISLARKVMEKLPHVMLVGEGADIFADECDLSCSANQSLLHPDALVEYQQFLSAHGLTSAELHEALSGEGDRRVVLSTLLQRAKVGSRHIKDTAVLIIYDSQGSCVVGTSTSGWFFKYPGRLGDSSIPGAGFFADSRYGAATCTHTGENSMRCLSSKYVVDRLKSGSAIAQALELAALEQNELHSGHLGELVLHGLTPNGEHKALICRAERGTELPHYFFWRGGMSQPEKHFAEVFDGRSA